MFYVLRFAIVSKFCIIYNPAARSERIRARLRELNRLAQGAVFRPTTRPGHAAELAEQAAREGFDTVVAAGGDGTLNEVLNGLMRAPGGTRPHLGVLPLGTVNVYARDLSLPLDMKTAWDVIVAGHSRQVDVGVARDGDGQLRYFAQLAGAGFDALAIKALDLELKKRIHWLAYVISGFQELRSRLPRLTVTTDGWKSEGHFVFIGNGRYYGGPFALCPNARFDDGKLDVCVFRGRRLRDVLRYAQGVIRGVHTGFGDVSYTTAKWFRVEADSAAPMEVDGELWGNCPGEFSVVPAALRVLAPAE